MSTNEQKHEPAADDNEIVVNGRRKTVSGKDLSFEAVVKLAFDNAFQNPNTLYTVTYAKGEDKKSEGSLVAGGSVRVRRRRT